LAKYIVTSKASDFEPSKFEYHYEAALAELINAKRYGKTIGAKPRPRGENVVDLMDALKKSIAGEASQKAAPEGLCRSEGDADVDRGEEARREEGCEARAVHSEKKSGIVLAVPKRCHSENRLSPNCL
jgi:DNA end-binding protein Ku